MIQACGQHVYNQTSQWWPFVVRPLHKLACKSARWASTGVLGEWCSVQRWPEMRATGVIFRFFCQIVTEFASVCTDWPRLEQDQRLHHRSGSFSVQNRVFVLILPLKQTTSYNVMHAIVVKTNSLQPRHTYVPWVILNGALFQIAFRATFSRAKRLTIFRSFSRPGQIAQAK